MNNSIVDYPVKGFPLKMEWYTGAWFELFEKQVELIQTDVKRAVMDDRLVVYLSCPLSSRGGGNYITNVEIAKHAEQYIMKEWGTGFWVLNPARYQLESKEGTGLIDLQARLLKLEKGIDINLKELKEKQPLEIMGGNYLRMWTRVLVEDDDKNLGDNFSAYYFLGPSIVRDFFTRGGSIDLTSGVEEYFARKYCQDPIFHHYFSRNCECEPWDPNSSRKCNCELLDPTEWEKRRREFFRFYTIRASANYSKGCHDEWNIWRILNNLRMKNSKLGIGTQIAGYFDGAQIDLGANETTAFPGYTIET
ncbi:hypothetical protein Q3A90_18075 [Priestia megaterium]|uniref:hypothetical protein n=1 Tax=Priestia megaterium TaxID=1404 RepID=UPI002676F897|nr:hypothetical protein [Priestia megaterium]WKU21677.1 hypothetical protein Q3A90_18075 [Priestia megaterium]